jgi:4-hydroxy-tetrahydrodipicolinate synthase
MTDIPMTKQLTRENLHGVWAAIATPFDELDRFDEGIFRENIRRLAAAGVQGVYTTDSDGEFYAIELDEFRQIIDVFADETQRLGIPTQVGCSWLHTKGVTDRLRIAAERGILGAHVAHPVFMSMTKASYRQFWADVRDAVPEWFGLIQYNHPTVPNYLYGPDYAELMNEVPNLIGSKHTSSSIREFQDLMAYSGELSHFAGDHSITPFMFLGARGTYSWFANFNPTYLVEWLAAIDRGDWAEARRRQQRMHGFIKATAPLLEGGNLGGIIGKALTAASDFLVLANRTRKPYLPISDEIIASFRRTVEEQFPDLLWQGGK